MHQSRVEAMNPASDDIRALPAGRSIRANLSPAERYVSFFAGTALLLAGLRRRSLPLLLGGGALLYRGGTGFCSASEAMESSVGGGLKDGLDFEETVTIQKPVKEVYSLWRRVENLPRFMSHLESVTPVSGQVSHWVAKIPPPLRLEWDAEIFEEQENQRISWRSLPGSSVEHSGSVFFHPARNGAEVKIVFSYRPPAGGVGAAVAKLLSALTEHNIREDLRMFKAMLEAGEKPTTAGQPSGRGAAMRGPRDRTGKAAPRSGKPQRIAAGHLHRGGRIQKEY